MSVFTSLTTLFKKLNGSASITCFWNWNTLSDIIDIWPVNVCAISALAPAIVVVPLPKASSIICLVSLAVYCTPSWKPNSDLIPLSLNKSAAAIPPDIALCSCPADSTNVKPDAAAMSPVIWSKLLSSPVLSATVNSNGEACAISRNWKELLAAASVTMSSALAPSSAEPVINLSCTPKFSTSTAASKNPLAILIPPSAAPTPSIRFRILLKPVFIPAVDLLSPFICLSTFPKAAEALLLAIMSILVLAMFFHCLRF